MKRPNDQAHRQPPTMTTDCNESGMAGLGAARGSAENVSLPNDTNTRFCNAFDQIKAHTILCKECDMYLRWGDGDLCNAGKTIIAMELCYADTNLEFPPNDQAQR